jgi:hypothetical protein
MHTPRVKMSDQVLSINLLQIFVYLFKFQKGLFIESFSMNQCITNGLHSTILPFCHHSAHCTEWAMLINNFTSLKVSSFSFSLLESLFFSFIVKKVFRFPLKL